MSFQTKLQNTTKLKKILQESKETVVESDLRSRMQLLKDQLASTISHLHSVFETHVFIAICRGYWDRMGQVSPLSFHLDSVALHLSIFDKYFLFNRKF